MHVNRQCLLVSIDYFQSSYGVSKLRLIEFLIIEREI